jgi:hypothetical protein
MALLEDIFEVFEDNALVALGIGATALLGTTIVPAVARFVKPAAKSAIKGGLLFYERGKESLAELKEVGEDVIAEARSEVKEELTKKAEAEEAAKAVVSTQEGS